MINTVDELLADHLGLNPESLGTRALDVAVAVRMQAIKCDRRPAYFAQLLGSRDELDALVDEVVVSETWFFRDGEPFQSLARWARQRPRTRPLRLLSLPCSTGEEPYSLAMALLDAGFAAGSFAVDAVDVSRRNLERAANATYGANSFRGGNLDFRRRYFSEVAGRWALAKEVRALVSFSRGNLADPQLLPGGPRYDVIFCRNVLIYLHKGARQRVMATLGRVLNQTGRLYMGHADSIETVETPFGGAGEPGAFAYDRRPEPRAAPGAPKAARPAAAPTSSAPPAALSPLEEAARLADQGRLAEAAELCETQLRAGGAQPAVFFLLGVIRAAEGRVLDAEQALNRALYLQPGHQEALQHLALLCDRRGDRAGAENFRRRAARSRTQESAS